MQIDELIGNEPWCAGVHVAESGRLLLTVGGESPGIPGPAAPRTHVRWIGGSGKAGETFADCARREAREELGCEVELLSDQVSWLQRHQGILECVTFGDGPAPFVVQHFPVDGWAIMYRARLLGEPRPVDVRGLVWVPFAALDALVEGVQTGQLAALGIDLLGESPSSVLFIGRGGLEDLLRTVHLDA